MPDSYGLHFGVEAINDIPPRSGSLLRNGVEVGDVQGDGDGD